MADLDEEFARFQAELASLEETTETAETEEHVPATKRAREVEESEEKRESSGPAKKAKTVAATPVVIEAKPQIYSAPPRPVPVQRGNESHVTASGGLTTASSLSASSSHEGGALSGFPVGTTGESAALSAGEAAYLRRAQLPVHRVDMSTGGLMSAEESQLMNMQQSVYEYDPAKAARANASSSRSHGVDGKPKKNLRMAGGQVWEDATLADWPDNDFRLFVGDLGNEVNDEILCHAFSRFASFQRARVVRDKYTHKTKGYGFVSFGDAFDCAKALREMNGKYIGNRPVKISKSNWQDRNIDVARKKAKKKNKHHLFG
jgi:hypothetical protein